MPFAPTKFRAMHDFAHLREGTKRYKTEPFCMGEGKLTGILK